MASAAILLIVGRTDDPLVEITLTTLAAYGSFLLAEHFGSSGIISALTAGLLVGGIGWAEVDLGARGRDRVRWAWEYFAFLANSFVFILIGMNVANQPLRRLGSVAAAVAILLVLAGRGLSIYPLAALFRGSRWRLKQFLSAYLVLGRTARRARPGARTCGAADGPRAKRDHSDGIRGRRLLDPRPGADDAVADRTPGPRPRSQTEAVAARPRRSCARVSLLPNR